MARSTANPDIGPNKVALQQIIYSVTDWARDTRHCEVRGCISISLMRFPLALIRQDYLSVFSSANAFLLSKSRSLESPLARIRLTCVSGRHLESGACQSALRSVRSSLRLSALEEQTPRRAPSKENAGALLSKRPGLIQKEAST